MTSRYDRIVTLALAISTANIAVSLIAYRSSAPALTVAEQTSVALKALRQYDEAKHGQSAEDRRATKQVVATNEARIAALEAEVARLRKALDAKGPLPIDNGP